MCVTGIVIVFFRSSKGKLITLSYLLSMVFQLFTELEVLAVAYFAFTVQTFSRSQYYRSTSLHKYGVKLFSATFLEQKKWRFENK